MPPGPDLPHDLPSHTCRASRHRTQALILAACGRLALTQTPALTLAFARRRSSCGLWTTRPYPNPSPNPSLRTQALILRLVDEYSAVTAITVTTLRKAGTLAASFALFPKPLSLGHPIGAALVLCSAFVKANLCCRRRRMLEAALLPAVHAAAARRSRGPPACSGLLYAPGPSGANPLRSGADVGRRQRSRAWPKSPSPLPLTIQVPTR
jgi:hypothetical protein